jgi:hypothetical protein
VIRICPLAPWTVALAVAASAARAEFVDVTPTSGLFNTLPTWGSQLLDIDQDGDVDVNAAHHFYAGRIFANDGAGTFDFFVLPQITAVIADRHAYTWVDLDGDEILDVVCSHGGDGGCGCPHLGNELWQGSGAGNFAVVVGAGGMSDSTGRGRAFSAADVDLDGDVDLYHAKAPLVASPNSLYRNDGALSFVDVAPAMGVDEVAGTRGGLFADYDDDGDPDLLVGGDEFSRATILWRNDGSAFTDATSACLGSLPEISSADWGDYDGDLDLDLALCEGREGVWDAWQSNGTTYWLFSHFRFSEDGVDAYSFDTPGEDPVAAFRFNAKIFNDQIFLGPNEVNPAPAAFTVQLTDAYVGEPAFSPGVDQGVWCWRESAGGRWQVRVSAPPGTFGNYSALVTTVAPVVAPADSALEQLVLPPASARIYRNDGGVFAEQTGALGFTAAVNPRTVAWVDFDNDGDLDLHQTNRGNTEIGDEPDLLWRNDGASFSPMSGPGWVPGTPGFFTDGGVWGDVDGDGDLDLYLAEGAGPVFFSATAPSTLYRNDGPAGNGVTVTVEESSLGGTPIGAKVTCWVQGVSRQRRVKADSWDGLQGPHALHFGLGGAAVFDSLVVVWPDGQTEVVPGGPDPTGSVIVQGGTAGSRPGFVGLVHPQPAFGAQRLELDVPEPGRLRVTVHDVTGRRIRVLADGGGALPGARTLTWDGRDASGRFVPPGVYFVHGSGDLEFSRKAVRIR